MLSELRVENLGIIAELQVTLGAGLTVITGETGAGKTLIVDALDLLTRRPRRSAAGARGRGRGARSKAASTTATTRSCSRASCPPTDGRAVT